MHEWICGSTGLHTRWPSHVAVEWSCVLDVHACRSLLVPRDVMLVAGYGGSVVREGQLPMYIYVLHNGNEIMAERAGQKQCSICVSPRREPLAKSLCLLPWCSVCACVFWSCVFMRVFL